MLLLIISTLLLLLFAAAWQDLSCYRIRNSLVVSGVVAGILMNSLLPSGIGLFDSLLGCAIGLLLLLPFYLFRVMGAGDVKLLAMVGAFVGPQMVIGVLVYVVLSGGVLAIAIACYRGVLTRLLKSLVKRNGVRSSIVTTNENKSNDLIIFAESKMPYGVAIAMGTFMFFIVNQSPLWQV